MIRRVVIAGICLISASALVLLLKEPSSPTIAVANGLEGERWYNLTLEDRHLGYWHTTNGRDSAGNWVFESEQRFAMNAPDPVSTSSRRVFAADPPHRLLEAEHRQSRRKHSSGIRIEGSADGYRSSRLPGGEVLSEHQWQYSLADYLDFELWLGRETPEPGRSRTVTTLDFDRTALVKRSFDIIERDSNRYTIENAAPWSATRIQLDEAFVPVNVEVAGLFNLRLSSRTEALAPRSALQSASYFIPVDRRLIDHTRISRLVLGVEGDDSPQDLFENAERRRDEWRLTLTANPASAGSVAPADLSETLNIPTSHPAIGALANQAVEGLHDDLARARILTRFVHEFLSYKPGTPPRGVLELLDIREGDCTEFADLLTTLARHVGLPSRTVFGLAYADGAEPAFAYHAWNELFVDGDWIAMDPTWGQERVDATHIPLPQDETAALRLLTGSVNLAFSVLEVEHFAGG
jgi:transglutaminase-like putative cysteine protease